ncbi:GGDEF domain-containing protein [Pullulanibacillus sp. KACC 23026]|uniref:GGDEF domain-containing protein n=1 Tax=Pullulanibacillus sp. KACC 23026 TaxID=3028315 RepID=UPI0023B14AAB|nr:GGDEF domain-containing protein [Pullulanibacillus sp. KACC 23026]WEG11800.1 GGDEF domain-containing protein [Pullulanibacillus sp. KACC 23026]
MKRIRISIQTKGLVTEVLFYLVGIIGIASIIYLISDLTLHVNTYTEKNILFKVLFYLALFLITYDWSVTLPSGAKWKPSIVFVLFSMLSFPISLSLVVVIPGILFSSLRKNRVIWDFFITIGHLSSGITSGSLLLHYALKSYHFHSDGALLAMTMALILHFVINRLLSTVILTYRKNNAFLTNLKAVVLDINWSYLCIYSLSLILVMVNEVYSYIGILVALVVLFSLFKSVSYYQKYRMIAKTVFFDGLTQAENRAGWEIYKDELKENDQSGTLVMIDLDDFKEVNDNYGHTKGDDVLKKFVGEIKVRIPSSHRLFRYGGDEFVLFIPHPTEQKVFIQEQIRNTLYQLNRDWSSQGLPVTASFGMTEIHPADDLTEALEKADARMYEEKQRKKI